MNNKIISTVLSIVFIYVQFVSCKKNQTSILVSKTNYTISKINTDSITLTSFIVNYRYTPSSAIQTGIVTSTDSISLLSSTNISSKSFISIYNSTTQLSSCHIANLPGSVICYYKVYWKDANGVSFSKIYSQNTSAYSYTWLPNTPTFELLLTSNILLVGTNNPDVNNANYSIILNDVPSGVNQVVAGIDANNNTLNTCQISIPQMLLEGIYSFKLLYKGNIIFTSSVNVVGGTFTQVSTDPVFSGVGNYFLYNNKVYINYSSQSTKIFSDWDPTTNQWEQLPVPSLLQISKYAHGYLINNTVYFEPTSFGSYTPPLNDPTYREYLVTYQPTTGIWKTLILNDTTVVGGPGLNCYSSFVLNNKLYCIVQETQGTIANPINANVIKVFDPSNNSWTKVMNINLNNAWGYRAVVLNDNIYLLAAFADQQENAFTTFTNRFFLLNLNTQTLTEKSIWPIGGGYNATGTLDPYLFAFNNKIYVYGGTGITGSVNGASSTMASYDVTSNTWALMGPSIALGNATGAECYGFEFTINNNVYIGLGTNLTSFSNQIFRVGF